MDIQLSVYWQVLLAGVFVALIALLVFLEVQRRRYRERIRQVDDDYEALKQKVNSLQLASLESKLNPHLFKNILNSIQSHAYQTYFALDKLAGVLDYILYESGKKFVTPMEEIEFALNLIEINKIKVSPLFDLKIRKKINENEPLLTQKVMAPLISIDLIENAFKHADLQSPHAFISVVFEFRDSQFFLTVANRVSPRSPLHKEKSGLGTQTLQERLRLIYGKNFKLDRFLEGDTFIAHLTINLLEHKAEMLAAR